MTQWISVDDQLPTKNRNYLVYMNWGGTSSIEVDAWSGNCWTVWPRHITHWMELPEPPK